MDTKRNLLFICVAFYQGFAVRDEFLASAEVIYSLVAN